MMTQMHTFDGGAGSVRYGFDQMSRRRARGFEPLERSISDGDEGLKLAASASSPPSPQALLLEDGLTPQKAAVGRPMAGVMPVGLFAPAQTRVTSRCLGATAPGHACTEGTTMLQCNIVYRRRYGFVQESGGHYRRG
jgi:hypothetical protein